jgi:hypothetical protein
MGQKRARGALEPAKDMALPLLRKMSRSRVLRYLEQNLPAGTPLPEPRTLDRWKKEAPDDTSSPWTLTPDTADEAQYVFPVIAQLIHGTAGQRRYITQTEAAWVVAISRAAPGIAPLQAIRLAAWYMAHSPWSAADNVGEPRTAMAIDQWLALEAWDNREGFSALEAKGWVDRAPFASVPRGMAVYVPDSERTTPAATPTRADNGRRSRTSANVNRARKRTRKHVKA